MSNWDKLWKDIDWDKVTTIPFISERIRQIRVEGDKLIVHVLALEDALLEISIHKGLVSTKYIKDDALDAAKKLEAIRVIVEFMRVAPPRSRQVWINQFEKVLGE